ncbi:hypothetical protein V2J09_001738 [Rumex salicifolius]
MSVRHPPSHRPPASMGGDDGIKIGLRRKRRRKMKNPVSQCRDFPVSNRNRSSIEGKEMLKVWYIIACVANTDCYYAIRSPSICAGKHSEIHLGMKRIYVLEGLDMGFQAEKLYNPMGKKEETY